jgi:hypothetical protein
LATKRSSSPSCSTSKKSAPQAQPVSWPRSAGSALRENVTRPSLRRAERNRLFVSVTSSRTAFQNQMLVTKMSGRRSRFKSAKATFMP